MLKLDGLHKHNSQKKSKYAKLGQIVGEYYINFDTQHAKNSLVYCTIRPNFILNQVVNVERAQKRRLASNLLLFSSFCNKEGL